MLESAEYDSSAVLYELFNLKIINVTANSMGEIIIDLLSVNVTTMQEYHNHSQEVKIGWFDSRRLKGKLTDLGHVGKLGRKG